MADSTFYLLLILWVVMLAVAYFVADRKGTSIAFALLATLLLGPIGLLVVMLEKPKNAESPGPSH